MFSHTNASVDRVPYCHSVIPRKRLAFLAQTCSKILHECDGDVLEVGVYRGGSLLSLARCVQAVDSTRRVVGIDTFSGHPYSDGHPVHPKGKYSDVDKDEVWACLKRAGVHNLVELYEGRVESSYPDIPVHKWAFVHIDCDLYTPVKYCAMHIPNHTTSGGAIYFDDYLHDHCPGATRAILETFPENRLRTVKIDADQTEWSAILSM